MNETPNYSPDYSIKIVEDLGGPVVRRMIGDNVVSVWYTYIENEPLRSIALSMVDYIQDLETKLEEAILSDISARNPGIIIEKVAQARIDSGVAYGIW